MLPNMKYLPDWLCYLHNLAKRKKAHYASLSPGIYVIVGGSNVVVCGYGWETCKAISREIVFFLLFLMSVFICAALYV